MSKKNQSLYLVPPSPLPFLISLFLSLLLLSFVLSLSSPLFVSVVLLIVSTLSFFVILFSWIFLTRKECRQGYLDDNAVKSLKVGFFLFLFQEVWFFFAFFFMFFGVIFYHSDQLIEGWDSWPLPDIGSIDFTRLPLINTFILLLSGMTATWSHYALFIDNKKDAKSGLILTVVLGLIFLVLQVYEYHHIPFSFKENSYSTVFFYTTGLHGLHVLFGVLFLISCFFFMQRNCYTCLHHLSYEMCLWYWHLVDIIWIFVFIFFYVLFGTATFTLAL